MYETLTGRVRRIGTQAALVAGGLLVALGLCEVLTRVLGLAPIVYPPPLDRAESAIRVSDNPILGWELVPGHRAERPDLSSSFPFVNGAGQRDHERTIAKPAGTHRIIVLGDSVVMGLGIQAIDDLLAGQLARHIDRPDVEVLSFGVVGYNTRAEVELLRTKGLRYDPDLVLVVFTGNDFQLTNDFVPNVAADRPAGVEWLFVRSALFRALAVRLNWFHLALRADTIHARARQRDAVMQAAGEEGGTVEASLGDLMALARRHDFEVALVLWPTFTSDAVVDDLASPDVPRVEPIAAGLGIPVLRVSDGFRCDATSRAGAVDRTALYAPDGMHPTVEGAAVAAEAIARMLRDAGAWRPPILRQLSTPARRTCAGASGSSD